MPSDQIRIRVEEETLFDLVDILERERSRLLAARAEMRDYEVPAGARVYDGILTRLKLLQTEVDHARDQLRRPLSNLPAGAGPAGGRPTRPVPGLPRPDHSRRLPPVGNAQPARAADVQRGPR